MRTKHRSEYHLYIELMRIVLTIYIILMHGEYLFRNISCNRIFEGGYLGVEIFFIVSGYYMALKAASGMGTLDYFKSRCQTAHCRRRKPHFDFGGNTSPIVPYRHLPQTLRGLTADCRSLV